MQSAYLNPLTLPEEFEGKPAQITASLRKAIDGVKTKNFGAECCAGKAGRYPQKKELRQLLWDVHVSRLIADAIARFGQLRHTYVVVGWVPTAQLAGF